MRKLCCLILLVTICTMSAVAQAMYDGEIAYLQTSGKNALFAVAVDATKESLLEDNACKSLLNKLLVNGVENINNGQPLIDSDKQGKSKAFIIQFFEGEYKGFIEGVQRENGATKTSGGKFRGSSYVLVRYDQLLRSLEKRGYHLQQTKIRQK